MLEVEAPGGGPSSVDLALLDQSTRSISLESDQVFHIPLIKIFKSIQVELAEVEIPEELTDDCLLDKLIDSNYHVFVLSETGRPIFMS